MRDFQEFIEKKIAVINSLEFMQLCEEKGIKWCGGDLPTAKGWQHYQCVEFNKNRDPAGITGSSLTYYQNLDGYDVVESSEFLQPQTTIEIFQSKQTVVCLKKENGKVIARGVAKCSKDDVFNFDHGAELALNRMLEDSNSKEFLKPLRESCKSISKAFTASFAGIGYVNSAIKVASEEQRRLMEESLTKSNHIQGDAVDAILPKIKTLKDGTKIIKQDCYEVGDEILIKNKFHSGIQCVDMDFMPGNIFRVLQVKQDRETNNGIEHCYRVDAGDGFSWCVCQSDIKGKVIE